MAWDRNLRPRPQARAWEYWSMRLKKAGEYPAGAPKARPADRRSAAARTRSAGNAKKRRYPIRTIGFSFE